MQYEDVDLKELADDVAERLRTHDTDYKSDVEEIAVRAILLDAFRTVRDLRFELRSLALAKAERRTTSETP